MWFWGLVLGALIGAATLSLENVAIFALLGALALHILGPSLRRNRRDADVPVEAESPPVAVETLTLQQRVQALEARVAALEGLAMPATIGLEAPTASAPLQPAPVESRSTVDTAPTEGTASDLAGSRRPDAVAAQRSADADPAVFVPDEFATADTEPATPSSPEPLAPPVPWRDRLPRPLATLLFGGNLLVKAGVLILFLGLAFLLRYTAERVTVPVELRYAAVGALGAVLLAVGWMLRRRRAGYALTLQGAGIGVLYLTTLAAMKLQPLLPPGAGFAFLFAVAVLSALLAVLQNAPVLALVATLEGFAAPVLAASGQHDATGLLIYLLVLDIGIFVVAWFKAWRLLNLIGAVGTFTLASGWAQQWYERSDFGVVQTFLIVFFVVFAAIGLLFARRTLREVPDDAGLPLAERARRSLARVGQVDSALVFGVPMAAYGLEYLLVRPHDLGPAIAALGFGAFYLGLGRLVFATQPRGLALLAEAYAIVGAIYATLAIPLALEGQWTGSAWAIEAAGMYWLGQRQQRPYARGFAFLLLLGAGVQLLRSIGIDPEPGTPALHGSLLGPLLVAAGAFAITGLHRRGSRATAAATGREALAAAATCWLGLGALALLPWQTLTPMPACAVAALLGLAAYAVAVRLAAAPLAGAALALQAAMLVGFLGTLRSNADPAGAALAGGASGLVSAAALALALLGSGALAWRARFVEADAGGTALRPSRVLVATTLGGIALLHLAVLLGADWPHAAFWWTFGAAASLGLALRLRLPSLAGLAAAIHLAASTAVLDATNSIEPPRAAFAHLGFWTALALGVTALVAADRLRAAAAADAERRRAAAPSFDAERLPFDAGRLPAPASGFDAGQPPVAAPALDADGVTDPTPLDPDAPPPTASAAPSWTAATAVRWLPLLWGLGWWTVAWGAETLRVLTSNAEEVVVPAAWIGLTVVSAALARVIAIRRRWRELALADLIAPLPTFVIAATAGVAIAWPAAWRPAAAYGWLAWPVALAWHVYSLRQAQTFAVARKPLAVLHVTGLWFFTALAARGCEAVFATWGDDFSAWPLLGWALVPAIVVAALASRAFARRWPLTEQRAAYLGVGLPPIALYLIGWLWATNVLSAGDAAPLPYLPLLNPLELAQALIAVALLMAWRALPDLSPLRRSPRAAGLFAALTGWALLTGMVLRSCHHFANVPWQAEALFGSRLAEAALSIAWATCGVLAMALGHRRASRTVWIGGAVLLGVVVVKLFLVELADRGGLFRIVSFVGVGVLLLAVGYFAPVPPARSASKSTGAAA